jgi:hypothetical protein
MVFQTQLIILLKTTIHRLRIILRSNIFLGLYYKFIKYLNFLYTPRFDYFSKFKNIFPLNSFNLLSNFNERDIAYLKSISDKFLDGKVIIFNKTITMDNYSVDSYFNKKNSLFIYDKDTRFHWELYRSKYLLDIGLYYNLFKEEKYVLSIINHLKSWKKYSPLTNKKIPYNAMESSLKLMNLSLLYSLICDSRHFDDKVKLMLSEVILLHIDYTYQNYEITFYGLESNHGLTSTIALIYSSLIFPDHKFSNKWRNFGFSTLKRGLRDQFDFDGVNFESSTNYHRFVFELLIFLLAAIYKENQSIDIKIVDKIKSIGNSLYKLTHKNSMISRFGDNDGGKFLIDLNNFCNLEYLDWFINKKTKNYVETIFFHDIPEFKNFLNPDLKNNRVGNYVSYRNNDFSIITSFNNIGTNGKGNHQHNDFLSFELYSLTPFIVDPWSYCYTGNKEIRNIDRSTFSHNTVLIDNIEIVKYNNDKLFEMLADFNVELLQNIDNDKEFIVSMLHDGYKNLSNGSQIHNRVISVNKTNNSILVNDILTGNGIHQAEINFNIPKKYWSLKKNNSNFHFFNKNEEFILSWNLDEVSIIDSKISDNFLTSEESFRIKIKNSYTHNSSIKTIITYKKINKCYKH